MPILALAQCEGVECLKSPTEIKLDGYERRESILTDLGLVTFRWSRSVDRLFSKTPQFAVRDAASLVSRALGENGLKVEKKWEIVMLDEKLPPKEVPLSLISNCHPGWMVPPGNIYIVAQRVISGCSGVREARTKIGDSLLTEVLVHEFAHGVEFQILGNRQNISVEEAEGFATWFSEVALKKREGTFAFSKGLFCMAIKKGDVTFDSSSVGYTFASGIFHVVKRSRGSRGVFELLGKMRDEGGTFKEHALKKLSMSETKLLSEIEKIFCKE
jgi:hypothetical protein